MLAVQTINMLGMIQYNTISSVIILEQAPGMQPGKNFLTR